MSTRFFLFGFFVLDAINVSVTDIGKLPSLTSKTNLLLQKFHWCLNNHWTSQKIEIHLLNVEVSLVNISMHMGTT